MVRAAFCDTESITNLNSCIAVIFVSLNEGITELVFIVNILSCVFNLVRCRYTKYLNIIRINQRL